MTDADADAPPLSPRTWPAWLGIALGWTIARWPWWLQRAAAPWLGTLMRLAMVSRRRVARRNLEICFPELDGAARERLLRENFRSLGMAVFEFLRAWWGRLAPVDAGFELEGLEHLAQARANGRGVILISPHFTTLEMCTRLLCQRAAVAGMYRPHDSQALDWAVRRGRMRHAAAMFARGELRPALRYLKAGGVLWFAPDQESRRGDSVFVPFFGRPAWTLTSTHQLARLSGAQVLPLFHERLDDGRYRVEIGAPLADFPGSEAVADTARVMALVEAQVRRAPAQYLWMHKRFKTQPEGMSSPYR
ncbi:MAG: LpxL/LpxP family Kdo(2)-lipid IV(A) lauroyl/palmitoleoyl acyltransferase [Arenimonas sp.]